MRIPSSILRHLYTYGSLSNVKEGFRFALKNQISDSTITEVRKLSIDGKDLKLDDVILKITTEEHRASDITIDSPLPFHIGQKVDVYVHGTFLEMDRTYMIELSFRTRKFGILTFDVEDHVTPPLKKKVSIPYDKESNYEDEIIKKRQDFVRDYSGVELEHVSSYSFDPHLTKGNIENFTGVAQVPIGFAGPLTINGEYAKGDFIIPLATSEGTLVASYNLSLIHI
jgi:hydroxymethylglutaryl-CoA reductase (NADPH)